MKNINYKLKLFFIGEKGFTISSSNKYHFYVTVNGDSLFVIGGGNRLKIINSGANIMMSSSILSSGIKKLIYEKHNN